MGHSPQIHVAFVVNTASLNILDCEEPSDGAMISQSIKHARPWVTSSSCTISQKTVGYHALMSQEVEVGANSGFCVQRLK